MSERKAMSRKNRSLGRWEENEGMVGRWNYWPALATPFTTPYPAVTALHENSHAEANHNHVTNFLGEKLNCGLKSLQVTNLQSQPFVVLKYQFPSRGIFNTSQTVSLLQLPSLTSCQVKLLLLFPSTRVSWSSGEELLSFDTDLVPLLSPGSSSCLSWPYLCFGVCPLRVLIHH